MERTPSPPPFIYNLQHPALVMVSSELTCTFIAHRLAAKVTKNWSALYEIQRREKGPLCHFSFWHLTSYCVLMDWLAEWQMHYSCVEIVLKQSHSPRIFERWEIEMEMKEGEKNRQLRATKEQQHNSGNLK